MAFYSAILATQRAVEEAADRPDDSETGDPRKESRLDKRVKARETKANARRGMAASRSTGFFAGMLGRLGRQRNENVSDASSSELSQDSASSTDTHVRQAAMQVLADSDTSDMPSSAGAGGASSIFGSDAGGVFDPSMASAKSDRDPPQLSSIQRVSFDLLRMLETKAVIEEKRSRQLQRVYALYEYAGEVVSNMTQRRSKVGGGAFGANGGGEDDCGHNGGGGTARDGGAGGGSPSTQSEQAPEVGMSTRRLSAPTLTYLESVQGHSKDDIGQMKISRKSLTDDGEKKPTAQLLEVVRVRVWDLMSEPESSRLAMAISLLILLLIMIGSVTFCMETMSQFQDENEEPLPSLEYIELFSIGVFTIELTVKLASCPSFKEFFSSYLNWIDVVAVLPFYVELAAAQLDLKGTRVLRIVRLVRVFRILKLGGKFEKLQVVSSAMVDSLDMLAMMMFLLVLSIIIFSTLAYFAEQGHHDCPAEAQWCLDEGTVPANYTGELGGCVDLCTYDYFQSIPHAFWWCMVTLMTVGYGDANTVTVLGKIVASVTMLVSVLILALPISVIGANFTQQWVDFKKRKTSSECGKKLAPQFHELTEVVKDHDMFLGEVVRKIRDLENGLDDSIEALREKITIIQSVSGSKDDQNMRKYRAGSLENGKRASDDGDDNQAMNSYDRKMERLFDEVDEIIVSLTDARGKLLQLVVIVQQMVCEGFIPCLDECRRKYKRLDILTEDWNTMQGDSARVDLAIAELRQILAENANANPE